MLVYARCGDIDGNGEGQTGGPMGWVVEAGGRDGWLEWWKAR